jgi:hypothetical protein
MNSAAFERVILYSIQRHLAHQKTALQFSVSRVLAESTDLRGAADGILSALCEFARFDRGEIWQGDASPSQVALLTSWPRSSPRKPPAELSQAPVAGEDLVGQVLRSCAPASTTEPHAAVAIPLSVGAGALGVLALFGPGTQGGDEDFAKLLISVGGQLGQFMARKTAEAERESLGTERLIILDSTSEGIYGLDRNAEYARKIFRGHSSQGSAHLGQGMIGAIFSGLERVEISRNGGCSPVLPRCNCQARSGIRLVRI